MGFSFVLKQLENSKKQPQSLNFCLKVYGNKTRQWQTMQLSIICLDSPRGARLNYYKFKALIIQKH